MTTVLPVITSRPLPKLSSFQKPISAWLETLNPSGYTTSLPKTFDSLSSDEASVKKITYNNKLSHLVGMIDIHPSIFGVTPRLDILFRNVYWQQMYRKIDYSWTPTRAEMVGRNKKPWPQKGQGKARHGSRLSPQWMGG
jgi:hypothetical protein